MASTLNNTGCEEISALLKKARVAKVIGDTHTDAQLISYQAAVINRTFK